MTRRNAPLSLSIYQGGSIPEDQVYEWCRRSPYFMSFGETTRICRAACRPARDIMVEGYLDVSIFPALVVRLRALALSIATGDDRLIQIGPRPRRGWRRLWR